MMTTTVFLYISRINQHHGGGWKGLSFLNCGRVRRGRCTDKTSKDTTLGKEWLGTHHSLPVLPKPLWAWPRSDRDPRVEGNRQGIRGVPELSRTPLMQRNHDVKEGVSRGDQEKEFLILGHQSFLLPSSGGKRKTSQRIAQRYWWGG